ncbi:MAG: ATP-binding protein [Rhodospirillales bacterium]
MFKRCKIGIRTQIILLQVAVLLLFAGFLQTVWLPDAVNRATLQQELATRSHLGTVAEGLVPLLLEGDLASVYESLDSLRLNNGDWVALFLRDPAGRSLYPLHDDLSPAFPHALTLKQDVRFLEEDLGQLTLVRDIGPIVDQIKQVHGDAALGLFAVLLLLAGLSAAAIDQSLRRPIRRLAQAAQAFGEGRFDAPLPRTAIREVDCLVGSFEDMRKALADYQSDMERTVSEQTEKIRKNAEFIFKILATMPSGLLVHRACRVVTTNRSFQSVLGLEGIPVKDVEVEDVLRSAGLGAEAVERIVKGEPFSHFEIVYPASNGDVRVLDVTQTTFSRATSSEETEFLVMFSDATQRWKAAREQERLEGELRQAQKMEALGTLAGGIAHEINTPIQFIGDNLRFLEEAGEVLTQSLQTYRALAEEAGNELDATDLPAGALFARKLAKAARDADAADLNFFMEEVPEAAGQSLRGVQQVADIVRAMKEFSHPSSKDKVAVDLNKAVENTLTVCRNEWKHVADLRLDLAADLPTVSGLPGEINQVLLNIFVNAAQALGSQVGGVKGEIHVTTVDLGDQAEIRIADTGPGMSEDVRRQIFDPFFTTKDVGKGTGQGLALSWDIITDKHGGELLCESAPGEGATFIIRLPKDNATARTRSDSDLGAEAVLEREAS